MLNEYQLSPRFFLFLMRPVLSFGVITILRGFARFKKIFWKLASGSLPPLVYGTNSTCRNAMGSNLRRALSNPDRTSLLHLSHTYPFGKTNSSFPRDSGKICSSDVKLVLSSVCSCSKYNDLSEWAAHRIKYYNLRVFLLAE